MAIDSRSVWGLAKRVISKKNMSITFNLGPRLTKSTFQQLGYLYGGYDYSIHGANLNQTYHWRPHLV